MDERQTQRVVTDLEVEARIRGRSVTVLVYDLSQGGCMIELPEQLVKPSDNLRLRFLDFEIGGYIAWEHGGFAGMKFYHELGQAIVARLGFRLRGTPFSEVQPRDRYGRPLPAPSATGFPLEL
jgi:hypothetical protein